MNDGLKRDIQRYLSQRADRDRSLWATPVDGVEPMSEVTQPSAPTRNEDVIRPATSAARAIASKQEQASISKPVASASSGSSSNGWERGAPEPHFSAEETRDLVDPFPEYSTLDAFNKAIQGCQKCPLGATRQNFVFGVGDPNADLVLVGEAPGAEEDKKGQPFVGRAGQLLDKILAAVDLKRGEGVYICNILKCRPPNNRDPQPLEVHECEPHLLKQLQLLQPKLIVALGRIAAQTLLRTSESLTRLREKELDYHGIPLIVTYHPAALLRNPNWKRPTWEDVQKMKRMLDEARGV